VIAGFVIYGAIGRLVTPPSVRGGLVVAVAGVGVLVNLAATLAIGREEGRSLNIQGALQHTLTDLYAFVATAVAGVLILTTGFERADAIASLIVAALMLRASVGLLRESGRVFLEAAPRDLDPGAIGTALAAETDVVEVHDLHVWAVTSGFPALAAHVLVSPGCDCHAARRRVESLLRTRFAIEHTTLQVDHENLGLVQIDEPGGSEGFSALEAH
jgi:cobalt-zinc-cadmium efflux system protein